MVSDGRSCVHAPCVSRVETSRLDEAQTSVLSKEFMIRVCAFKLFTYLLYLQRCVHNVALHLIKNLGLSTPAVPARRRGNRFSGTRTWPLVEAFHNAGDIAMPA
jgi:hypothetical protein